MTSGFFPALVQERVDMGVMEANGGMLTPFLERDMIVASRVISDAELD